MKYLLRFLLTQIFIVCFWSVCYSQVKYNIIDLGTLGGSGSWGFAVNTAGQVVGSSFPTGSTTNIHPFLYSNGHMNDLNTLGGWATDINDSGQVVGTGVFSTRSHGFIYSNGHTTDMGTLGGTYSEGWGINNQGQAVGWAEISLNTHHAFLNNHGAKTDLGTLGGTSSAANAITDSGLIIGGANLIGDSISHAFLYSNGHMTDLGTLGGANSNAYAINNSRQIVGQADNQDGIGRAFIYENGIMTDLGTLGGPGAGAFGINDIGQVVGGANTAPDIGHAFLFSDGNMIDLNSSIDSSLGWELNSATSITNSGLISGSGMIHGQNHAFLLIPDTTGQTGINENGKGWLNQDFRLDQNYPNPFNPSTIIQYSLKQSSAVKLIVYDLTGQKVKTLINSFQQAGEYSLVWNGTDNSNKQVASGIYFYRLQTDKMILQKKMILIR